MANRPESFQSTFWILQAIYEILDSCILKKVVTQVQLSQIKGLRADNRCQMYAACPRQLTATKTDSGGWKEKKSKT